MTQKDKVIVALLGLTEYRSTFGGSVFKSLYCENELLSGGKKEIVYKNGHWDNDFITKFYYLPK